MSACTTEYQCVQKPIKYLDKWLVRAVLDEIERRVQLAIKDTGEPLGPYAPVIEEVRKELKIERLKIGDSEMTEFPKVGANFCPRSPHEMVEGFVKSINSLSPLKSSSASAKRRRQSRSAG